jgi:hypothetical protein
LRVVRRGQGPLVFRVGRFGPKRSHGQKGFRPGLGRDYPGY